MFSSVTVAITISHMTVAVCFPGCLMFYTNSGTTFFLCTVSVHVYMYINVRYLYSRTSIFLINVTIEFTELSSSAH